MESSTASKKIRTKQEVLLRWSFPPNGCYKLNVDGTFRGGSGIAAGGVIRNENGEWVSGFAANLGKGKKPVEAELWALYRGLELACQSGWAPIVVESDSAVALKLLLDPIEKNLKHKQFDLIQGCQNLLNQMWMCSLNFVYRQQNSVADCLASLGLTLEMGCHYFYNPPPLCHSILVQDQCRVARPRSLRPSAIESRRVKKLRDVEEEEDLKSVVFTLKIDKFSKLGVDKHYSDIFIIGVFQWRILVHPRGNNVGGLSVYLDVTGSSTLPSGWARYAKFSLAVVNQLESSKSISKDTEHLFTKVDSYSGFTSLIPLSEFYDSSKGYLVNDTCIVEAKVAVHKAEIKIFKEQTGSSAAPIRPSNEECTTSGPSNIQAQSKCTSSQICTKPTEIRDAPPMIKEHDDASPTPDGELMDFRGLGKIQKTFVPLLEEVCSWHPSLIECQRKRSRMFGEWAFTALGRLLHFLKTGKVKDMTHDTSVQQLLLLWEELEAFGFDLAWLKPCVQRALGTKEMAERAGQLRRMREDVDALQSQTKMLRAALDVAEANLEAAIRNLDKNQQDFHEVDMDAGLWDGYRDFPSVACS